MPDPTLIEQLLGIVTMLMAFVSMDLLFSGAVAYYQIVRYGCVKRPPEQTLPGIIEFGRSSYAGHIPEFAGSAAGLIGGVTLYLVLGFIVILASFFSALFGGPSIPVVEFLYLSIVLSLIYTLAVQDDVRKKVSQSKWYLGYSMP